MNEFLYKIVEATGVMSTFRYLRQVVEWELFGTNAQMFSENLKELEMAVRTEEVSTTMQFLTYYCYKILTINRLKVFGFEYSENLGFRVQRR
jgi:hypothetical protein